LEAAPEGVLAALRSSLKRTRSFHQYAKTVTPYDGIGL